MAFFPYKLLEEKLSRTSGFWFTLYASVTAFCLYTCVYAFRKTFSVATFEGLQYWGVSYKVWLVTFQVVGYALSKFVGIKVIAELKAHSRALGILLMVVIAGLSWLFFAIVPPPYNMIFLFVNGFPLGLVWGMVFGYLEGRRMTEVLGASLSVSFIFSGGLCQSVGAYLIQDWHVSEFWMPFIASCIFLIPLLIFLFLLDKLPAPSPLDEALRTKRQPMNGADRKLFVRTFLPGIIFFVLAYTLLTIFRELRGNFTADVWKSLGYTDSPEIFARTETPISIIVLIIIGSLMIIRDNKRALMINHVIILFGMILVGVATLLFQKNLISAPIWMTAMGTGLYLGYVPFNSVFFDRLIATFQFAGTVGFIMYIADSFGYLGSVGVLFFKDFMYSKISWLDFFVLSGYATSIAGSLVIIFSMIYFYQKHRLSNRKNIL
jgi:MFS family permease